MRRMLGAAASVVVIIDCLGERDLQTGRYFYEGIRDTVYESDSSLLGKLDKTVQRFKVDSVECMDELLERIGSQLYSKNLSLFLLIDGHGDKERGLKLPNGGFFSWNRMLECFSKLTMLARGNLTVVGAFCYSAELINLIDAADKYNRFVKAPIAFFYGYEGAVSAGEIEEEISVLYGSLIKDQGTSFKNKLESGKLSLIRYDEYDFIIPLLAFVIGVLRPHSIGLGMPILSKKEIVTEVEKDIARAGFALSGISKILKKF